MSLAVEDRVVDHTGKMLLRTAIRLAVQARKTAVAGAREAGVTAQRVRFREQIARLNNELDETKATLELEIVRASGRERSLEIAIDRARERTERALSGILATRNAAEGLIVSRPDVLFDPDRTTLKPETRKMLSRVSGILQLIPGFHIQVEGRADSVGRADYNESLSESCAINVQDYLVSTGILTSSVLIKAFGETQPVNSNDTSEGREQNRRVQLVILDGPEQAARVAPEE
jgi:outer membrane protein OmpA-like peptidoglycan-associated protein